MTTGHLEIGLKKRKEKKTAHTRTEDETVTSTTKRFSHVLVHDLPATLVLQAGLGQVNGEHAGDPHHACDPSVDQLGWEAVGRPNFIIKILTSRR